MELTRYWRAIRRWAWLLILCPLLAGVSAAVVTSKLPRIYQSDVSILVRPAQPFGVDPNVTALSTQQIMDTYAQLITETPLMGQVVTDLHLNVSAGALAQDVTATPRGDTTILDVTVQNTDPAVAQRIANTLVGDFITNVKQMESQSGTASASQDNLSIVAPATLPTGPIAPRSKVNVALGAAGGLLVGILLVALFELLDQTVDDETLVRRLGLIAIGHIPFVRTGKGRGKGLAQTDPDAPAAEAFRSLRTNLLFSSVDASLKTVLVTSSDAGEGKSFVAANLASVMALAGHATLLVDADLRRPTQHLMFGRVRNVGLTNRILNNVPEAELVSRVDQVPNLWLMASGPTPPNPSEVLGSAQIRTLLAGLRSRFTFVVIDSPPIGLVTDAAVLANLSDGVVLVADQSRATVATISKSRQMLERVGGNLLGVVLNKVRTGDGKGYYGYYAPAAEPPRAVSAPDSISTSAAGDSG